MLRLRARDGRDPKELAAMDLEVHLRDRVLKANYVRTMFDTIAPGYDAFTRLFSFGMDKGWKKALIAEAVKQSNEPSTILDLACGTADFALQLAQSTSAHLVLGFDLSPQMLREARERIANQRGKFVLLACDMQRLCLRDKSVDVVSIGYGLRNTGDVAIALGEIARVLRPGGILINLDFNRPVGSLWRELFLLYMWHAGRLAGWLWHREPTTYGYLATSIRNYLTVFEFEQELARAGFKLEWRKTRLGGAIGMHIARRVSILR